jgi:hypothetical protein
MVAQIELVIGQWDKQPPRKWIITHCEDGQNLDEVAMLDRKDHLDKSSLQFSELLIDTYLSECSTRKLTACLENFGLRSRGELD